MNRSLRVRVLTAAFVSAFAGSCSDQESLADGYLLRTDHDAAVQKAQNAPIPQ